MSDIKLFRIDNGRATELQGRSVNLERKLQQLIEHNLEVCLGVRFLASEYSTGRLHGGRIDTLGIDENHSPVIIEYKRTTNENVINQGLFYLDWLLDHRAEFTMLAAKVLGGDVGDRIDWSGPRLVCIAGDFTRYDEHAVRQINRNIELLRYRHYDDGYLVLELVNSSTSTDDLTEPTAPRPDIQGTVTSKAATAYTTVSEYLDRSPEDLRALYQALSDQLTALGDDVTVRVTKYYVAFRRIKNFASVEVHPVARHLLVFVKVNPDTVTLEDGFTRDVRTIGHFGTGDLEIRIKSLDDLERAKPLLIVSYERS